MFLVVARIGSMQMEFPKAILVVSPAQKRIAVADTRAPQEIPQLWTDGGNILCTGPSLSRQTITILSTRAYTWHALK